MAARIGFIALSLVACGGTPERAGPPSTAQAPASVVASADATAALAAREPPAHAPLWLRFATPAADLRELAAIGLGLDPQLKLALENPDRVLQASLGPALANSFDLDQPVDVLLPTVSSTSLLTVAFRPRDPVALVSGKASIRLVELAPGRWSLEPIDSAPPKVAAVCELWRAPAGAKLRIVCAPSADQVAASAAFLVGAAAESQSQDSVRLELGGEALKQAIAESNGEHLATDDPRRTAREAGRRIAENLLARVDTWAGALTLNNSDVELGTDIGFGRNARVDVQSWLGAERSLPLDSFARLPRDAELTFAFAGIEHSAAEQLLQQGASALVPALEEHYELSAQFKEQVKGALLNLVPPRAAFVLALGRDDDEIRKLNARIREREASAKPPEASDLAALESALEGWVVIGLDTDPTGYIAALREAHRVTSVDPPRRPAPARPDGSANTAKAIATEFGRISIAASPPKGLPADTLYWLQSVRPSVERTALAGGQPARRLDIHYLAVPDGARVWIVTARALPVAVERARAQLAASAVTARADAVELSSAVRAPLLAFGRVRLARLFTTSIDTAPGTLGGVRTRLTRVDTLPHQGKATLPYWITLQSPGESTPHAFRLQTRLPQDAVEDLVHWLKNRG